MGRNPPKPKPKPHGRLIRRLSSWQSMWQNWSVRLSAARECPGVRGDEPKKVAVTAVPYAWQRDLLSALSLYLHKDDDALTWLRRWCRRHGKPSGPLLGIVAYKPSKPRSHTRGWVGFSVCPPSHQSALMRYHCAMSLRLSRIGLGRGTWPLLILPEVSTLKPPHTH